MRFLMASFHLCGKRAEHTVHVAVLGIMHLVLDCLVMHIYKLAIDFFWWLNDRCGILCLIQPSREVISRHCADGTEVWVLAVSRPSL